MTVWPSSAAELAAWTALLHGIRMAEAPWWPRPGRDDLMEFLERHPAITGAGITAWTDAAGVYDEQLAIALAIAARLPTTARSEPRCSSDEYRRYAVLRLLDLRRESAYGAFWDVAQLAEDVTVGAHAKFTDEQHSEWLATAS